MKFKERMELNNKTINIIGDIAGRYDELQLLLAKMPKADLVIAVGDLIDRGPKSKEVVEYFINTPDTIAIRGNHEELMIEACETGDTELWYVNGGWQTVLSYGADITLIPKEHIDWLKSRPLYFDTDDLIISHAPITNLKNVPLNKYSRDPTLLDRFLWNRIPPFTPMEKFHVYGHNGRILNCKWGNGKVVATCIDGSHAGTLGGMHWPTKEIFIQPYI